MVNNKKCTTKTAIVARLNNTDGEYDIITVVEGGIKSQETIQALEEALDYGGVMSLELYTLAVRIQAPVQSQNPEESEGLVN